MPNITLILITMCVCVLFTAHLLDKAYPLRSDGRCRRTYMEPAIVFCLYVVGAWLVYHGFIGTNDYRY